jgi:hypothetical protein
MPKHIWASDDAHFGHVMDISSVIVSHVESLV